MSRDVLVRCRCCGKLFAALRPLRGPLAAYCSGRCRQGAYRARVHSERACLVADQMLASSHSRLVAALAALSAASLLKLHELLESPLSANPSPATGDRLWSDDTTDIGGVVVALHKES